MYNLFRVPLNVPCFFWHLFANLMEPEFPGYFGIKWCDFEFSNRHVCRIAEGIRPLGTPFRFRAEVLVLVLLLTHIGTELRFAICSFLLSFAVLEPRTGSRQSLPFYPEFKKHQKTNDPKSQI